MWKTICIYIYICVCVTCACVIYVICIAYIYIHTFSVFIYVCVICVSMSVDILISNRQLTGGLEIKPWKTSPVPAPLQGLCSWLELGWRTCSDGFQRPFAKNLASLIDHTVHGVARVQAATLKESRNRNMASGDKLPKFHLLKWSHVAFSWKARSWQGILALQLHGHCQ